ncbi:MAG: tripartite tricarboxylate transporter substrate binding protein [Burkholderiales bacterium]|nr:tripartite tricarboxylate transporter substrate binding protein [Burkholderiales bacterium]
MRAYGCLIAFFLMTNCVGAGAQGYPERPIRFVVPFAAGGATDIVTRALGQKLAASLGQFVIIDNRGGAGGVIGTDIVAKAHPDGYTFLMASAANAANASLIKNLPHDFIRDLTPITLVVMSPYMLVTHPSVAKTVPELIALAKSKPRQINYASSGTGSSQHLTNVMFDLMAGIETVHIPYKGAGAVFADLVSGRIQMFFSAIPGVLPHVKAGKVNALAVSSATRSMGFPQIPTVAESGVPGFDMSGWYGALAPRGVPAPVVDRINKEAVKAISSPDMRELLIGMGLNPVGNTPKEYAEFIRKEFEKYSNLTKRAQLKID